MNNKNLLFVCFRRKGDILFYTNLLNQKYRALGWNIDIITFEENRSLVSNISLFKNSFYLSRERIITSFHSKIFPTGHSESIFINEIAPVLNHTYSLIFNGSNDKIGLNISTLISEANNATVIGEYLDGKNKLSFNPDSIQALNEFLTIENFGGINQLNMYENKEKFMHSSENNCLVRPEKYETQIKELFLNIRYENKFTNRPLKMIGIQIFSNLDEKSIPDFLLKSIIDKYLDEPSLFPILIISPDKKEIEYAHSLNEYFDNKLTIIESNLSALNCTISNLDALISPDTMTVHLADLAGIPVLEIVNSSLKWRRQATKIKGNLVVELDFKKDSGFNKISVDLCSLTKYLTGLVRYGHVFFSSNATIYRCDSINESIFYMPIYGESVNSLNELFLINALYPLGKENIEPLCNNFFNEPLYLQLKSEIKEMLIFNTTLMNIYRLSNSSDNHSNKKQILKILSNLEKTKPSNTFSYFTGCYFLNLICLSSEGNDQDFFNHVSETTASVRRFVTVFLSFSRNVLQQHSKARISNRLNVKKQKGTELLLQDLSIL